MQLPCKAQFALDDRRCIAERSDACATRSLAAMQKGPATPGSREGKDKELVALERSASARLHL
jgi:hypothetical protein